jgi:microcompartment protein CcmL/EutN
MWDALGVLEAYSATAGIEAGDTAAKEADIWIPEIRLVEEMGGKSFVKMIGPIDAVQAAMEAGVRAVRSRGLFCRQVIIPQPHPEIRPFVL